jgi:hypothetical protein
MSKAGLSRERRLPPSDLLSLDSVRARLTAVWLVGAGLVFVLVVVQSLLGHYEDKTQEAWGWLLPTIMPTLGLIITGLGYTALDPVVSRSRVRRVFFLVALWLSVLYLFLILLTIVVQPFVAPDANRALNLMRISNLWLGPFQGLVASALGVLFVSKRESHPPADDPDSADH